MVNVIKSWVAPGECGSMMCCQHFTRTVIEESAFKDRVAAISWIKLENKGNIGWIAHDRIFSYRAPYAHYAIKEEIEND